ncbi:MAG: hypothetical protein Q4G34_06850 [Micrococcus sp.]|nr:hypothetical protein [Micrococcus sp.]
MSALILLAIGVHDLLRAVTRDRALSGARLWLLLSLAVALAAAGGGLTSSTLAGAGEGAGPGEGAHGWVWFVVSAVVALGVAVVWHRLDDPREAAARTRGARSRLVLLAEVGLLAGLEASLPVVGAALAPPWLAAVAAGVALVSTANLVTRDVLELAGRPSSQDEAAPGLRGGRFIGPMERLLMAALGLVGAFPVVAALMAAKGIVRFPEISRAGATPASGTSEAAADVDGGAAGGMAEEFLVGSLASWTLAAGGALLVYASLLGHP